MEFSMGGGGGGGDGGCGDEQDAHNSQEERKSYRRHSSHQIARLEEAFKLCPRPDEDQRCQLGKELGLEPKQIKFWFQNKRTQLKTHIERSDNTFLRDENEKMKSENFVIREALKSVVCASCGGGTSQEEQRHLCLQNLKLENAKLKQERERLTKLLATYQLLQPPYTLPSSSHDHSPPSLLNQGLEIQDVSFHNKDIPINPVPVPDQDIPIPVLIQDIIPALDEDVPSLDQDFDSVFAISEDDDMLLPNMITSATLDNEKVLMVESANTAVEELERLLRVNEPFWFRYSVDGNFILHRESYEKVFPRANRFKGGHVLVESSKASGIVSMNGTQLVDMVLDSDKWVDLFPTIVTKAQTIQVLESGLIGSRSGALQLVRFPDHLASIYMCEEMHILSPMVPSREFLFLRYCKQVEIGVWVIADVSFNSSKVNNASLSRTWRLPSGFMIQQMPNGSCKVTWVEHVEVDDKIQTHRLYRDLVCGHNAFGAQRWVFTLQRMCERFAWASIENIPIRDIGGVINSVEGRRSVLKLAHRMVKGFCGISDMSSKLDFTHLTKVNNSGVTVTVRKAIEAGVPSGMIVIAATSLWLPLSPHNVFDFFIDHNKRNQWDALSYGNPVHEIAHISNGSHPGNYTSIIQPFIPNENNMLIVQESFIDPLGSMVIYAPVDVATMEIALREEDYSNAPILPSGFMISGDGRANNNAIVGGQFSNINNNGLAGRTTEEGSLVTVVFQILACSPNAIGQQNMDSVAVVNTLITSTVQKIKVALGCADLD